MPFIHQIRGALLEEAILALLRAAGYNTVLAPGNDSTLLTMGGGLGVRGRGADHQIDAIADFRVAHPFSNAQRLLVEAKFYADHRTIGIEKVRNAVGVLKDVSEYWTRANGGPATRRYHYQSALFSASRFSADAQQYAFAHDVYLLPLARSLFFQPVLSAINEIAEQFEVDSRQNVEGVDLGPLRSEARLLLQNAEADRELAPDEPANILAPLVRAVRQLRVGLIGTIGRGFHVFLVPAAPAVVQGLKPVEEVRIRWDAESWYIYRGRERLFSFDVPEELVDLYAERGQLTPRRALELKMDYLNEIQSVYVVGEAVHVTRLQMDMEWLSEIRSRSSLRRS